MKKILSIIFLFALLIFSTPAWALFGDCEMGDCGGGGTSNVFSSSSTSVYITDVTKYFGVGTTTPQYLLDVNGPFMIRGQDGIIGPWGTYLDFYNGVDYLTVGGTATIPGIKFLSQNKLGIGLIGNDGTNTVLDSANASATLGYWSFSKPVRWGTASTTIASNGAGTHASATITITTGANPITCNDTDGCDITFNETDAQTNGIWFIQNVGSNPIYISPSSNVLYVNNKKVLKSDDSCLFQYYDSQWNAVACSITSPTTQTIASGDTINDDACGQSKYITAAGAVTTSTSATFTAPATANRDCRMTVCNTGANTITLDAQTNFKTTGGLDVALSQYNCVNVMSTGSGGVWIQTSLVTAN